MFSPSKDFGVDIMVDLETTGKSPGSNIFAIGAVAFSPEEGWISHPFFALVNTKSGQDVGLTDDADIMEWWSAQDPKARKYLDMAQRGAGQSLTVCLENYKDYLNQWGAPRPWGNGSDFDNAMLHAAYKAIGQDTPWHYRNSRCHRTIAAEHPDITVERFGVYHNALDDAITQASLLIHVLRHVRNLPPLDRPIDVSGLKDASFVTDPSKPIFFGSSRPPSP